MGERNYSDFSNAKDVLDVFNAIMNETRPIDGHSDPGAINDCADTVREFLEKASQQKDSGGVWICPDCGDTFSLNGQFNHHFQRCWRT